MKNSFISIKNTLQKAYHEYIQFIDKYGAVISRYGVLK